MTKKTITDPPTTSNNDELDQLLASIKLSRIRQIVDQQLQAATKSQSAYSDFLVTLLREEFLYRQQQSIEYRIRQSGLPERLALETFPFKKQPSINVANIRELAKLDFVQRASNITFIGEAGVGKSGLATGLLLKAMANGYRGYFISAQDLFDEIYTSLADRSTRRLLNRLMRVDVLVIDEMGYLNLKPEQCNAFFKLMHERYAQPMINRGSPSPCSTQRHHADSCAQSRSCRWSDSQEHRWVHFWRALKGQGPKKWLSLPAPSVTDRVH